MHQPKTPRLMATYMRKETCVAGMGFVLQIAMVPGMNDPVVNTAEIKPNASIRLLCIRFSPWKNLGIF